LVRNLQSIKSPLVRVVSVLMCFLLVLSQYDGISAGSNLSAAEATFDSSGSEPFVSGAVGKRIDGLFLRALFLSTFDLRLLTLIVPHFHALGFIPGKIVLIGAGASRAPPLV
jgi:hypothetical protein